MTLFKAGYYIDEFNDILGKIVSKDVVSEFYNKNTVFSISDFPDYINEDELSPLFKVAWNIIWRGELTRAPIRISDSILQRHLSGYYEGVSKDRDSVRIKINDRFYEELNGIELSRLLSGFGQIDELDVATEFGSKYLSIYRVLRELIFSAQLQKTFLLLYSSGLIDFSSNFRIIGIHSDLAAEIVNDINDLFTSLNSLAEDREQKLFHLEIDDESELLIGFGSHSGFVLAPFQVNEDNIYHKILTDRRVNYKSLGAVYETELNGKYIQKFEYSSRIQKDALEYLLNNIFRKTKFRPGQESIIDRALQGFDVIGLLPTGGGKSLTYQVCALLQPGVTVVVDPINSLMKDQHDKLLENGIGSVNYINSFNSKEEREAILRDLSYSKYLILFVSPERFQIEIFRTSLGSCYHNSVFFSYAVIDEAHCVSEWGHDFRHTYLKLAQNLRRFCRPKEDSLVLFGLTATASFDVLADVQRELEMPDNAIISLPAEAIDRKELNFEIVGIGGEFLPTSEYWVREKGIGAVKYPILDNLIKTLPQKIHNLEKKYGITSSRGPFFDRAAVGYVNGGIIFCPSKSNRLPNGVLYLSEFLKSNEKLSIGTFFGAGDDNTIKDEQIEKEAKLSYQNQEDFIKNERNLMVATKAFGMGIDKPNIRYSIHYTFPNSVESFYQEAGRAGRDGNPSLCSILYHPSDIYTNYDFYKNSFKGVEREIEIIDELLTEVKYEDKFFLNLLKAQIQERFPDVKSVSLSRDRYIYINGTWREKQEERVCFGNIDLERALRTYEDSAKNVDIQKANEVINYAKDLLRKAAPNGDYIGWLKTKSADGVKTLIESSKSEKYSLIIGFTNDTVTKITEVLRSIVNGPFEEVIVRAAYNFSSDGEEFIGNLNYQYGKYTGFLGSLEMNPDTRNYLIENYYKIRNSSDTQRAIYRMSVVGIIDDYVIDYSGGFIEVRFESKEDETYCENFRTYLKRYLGNQSTEIWLSKINQMKADSILKKVLYTLISFIDEEISDKRKRSIDYMQQLCELGLKNGDKTFRENIVFYFTSKYARMDYLPRDTDSGRLEKLHIVNKYLDYISKPPDGLGGEIDNAKHLRGACANLRITMTRENASIDLLTSFSLFALESTNAQEVEKRPANPMILQAIELYRKGFKRFIELDDEPWPEIRALILKFNAIILDINPVMKPLVEILTKELVINRTSYRLRLFLNQMN